MLYEFGDKSHYCQVLKMATYQSGIRSGDDDVRTDCTATGEAKANAQSQATMMIRRARRGVLRYCAFIG